MEAYQCEKKVAADGSVLLNALPFPEGELVEVIVLSRNKTVPGTAASPIAGKVVTYIDPTEPVAQGDWAARP